MKTAIYARYSSDNQRETSIEDQFRLCREHAEREGWKIVGTYHDAAISGASLIRRPGVQALLAEAQQGAFDIVLAEALDRVSRDQADVATLFKHLHFAGVQIVTLAEGEINELHVGFKGTMNALFLKDLADKTRRGLRGRIEKGRSAGGNTYGYDVVKRTDCDGEPIRGERAINEAEAEVVQQIFRWFAEGRGYREIAGRLNVQQIPSPRGGTWTASSIRPMLRNEVYVGRAVWNRRQWVRNPETGRRVCRLNPESKWITKDAPKLRLLDDRLWQAVQARRDELLTTHRERQKDGKQRPGKAPTYLFSSIVKCGTCGGDYIKANKTHYRCSTYINKGKAACDNGVSVRKDMLEEHLLHAIKTELFDDDSFETFKAEARRVLDQRMKNRKKDTAKQQRELTKVEREIANMVDFVKAGNITPTLSDELRKAEAEKERLAAELSADVPAIDDVEEIFADVLDRYASMAFNLETFAARDVTKARNMIKALVGGHITLRPTGRGGLEAELRGDYGGLIQLVAERPSTRAGASKVRMVAGAGFEPATFRL